MKTQIKILLFFISCFFASNLILAQDSTKIKNQIQLQQKNEQQVKGFVDIDGDGYNDNAPDHDGDGIPNGLDPDYIKLKKRENENSAEYIDSNGDGINDNLQFNSKTKRGRNRFKMQVLPQSSSDTKIIGGNQNHQIIGKGKGRG